MSALEAWLHRAPGDRRQCRCIYRGVDMGPRMGGYWHDHWHDEPCTVPMTWVGLAFMPGPHYFATMDWKGAPA